MSNLTTLPKGDSAWLLRKSIQRIMQQVSVLETNIGSSTTGNSANTQVIFNDAGTLRGDAGLTYNAATDTLSAGSATITGDLTVDTSTLKVVAASDVVGINTASPLTGNDAGLTIGAIGTVKALNIGLQNTFARLREKDAIDAFAITTNITGSNNQDDATKSSWKVRMGFGNGNDNFLISRSGVGSTTFQDLYSISTTSAVWSDGAGGTRMTLNSTGLGIGASPAYKLTVQGADNSVIAQFGGTNRQVRFVTAANGGFDNANFIVRHDSSVGGFLWQNNNGANTLLTIDSTGNVGIGVTPSAWNTFKAIQHPALSLASYSTTEAYYSQNAYNDGTWRRVAAGYASQYIQVNSEHRFLTAGTSSAGSSITFTQAMTLDASGNLLVGKTTTAATALGGVAYIGRVDCSRDTGNAATFNHTTAGNLVGNIAITSTATTYNSASDYRLKEAVQPLSGGLARVSALKPSIYKWKVDGSSGEGFLAHELADVVPLAVTGEKDAVDADGKPTYQGVDLSKVVPILVAAIQELTARVQTLEAK